MSGAGIIDAGRGDVSVSFSHHVLSTRGGGIRDWIPLTVHLLHLESEKAVLKVERGDASRRVYHLENHLVIHLAVVNVILLKARVYRNASLSVCEKRIKTSRRIRKNKRVASDLKRNRCSGPTRAVTLCA
jgi:hypothetical protein